MWSTSDVLSANDGDQVTYPGMVRFDAQDNKVYRSVLAHTTLTVGTLYAIHPGVTGPVSAALADDADVYRVGVGLKADTASTVSWLQTGGYYAALTTPSLSTSAGHCLGIGGGAIVDEATAVPINAKTFALNVDATTTATSHNVILLDREITAST